MARRYDRFGRRGAFRCGDCGRLTRETAENAGLDDLCGLCAELAMMQNGISDYGGEPGDRERSAALRREIVKRGGTLNDGMTWAEEDPIPVEADGR
jgi:hypothetical protein